MFRTRKMGVVAAALAVTASLGLAACGGDSGDEGDSKTLKLWHYESPASGLGIAWTEAIKQFKASHPGVEVVFEEKGFEQIRQNAGMILNSNEAPDIMEYNKGNASAGLLSKQGLLTDMSEEVTKRGWDAKTPASIAITSKYDQDGIMGGDKWYGVTNYGEYVMVYYNKDEFKKLNLEVPTTLAEFETVMQRFKDAGKTPLAVGGAEYPAQQIFYQLALSQANTSFVDDYQLYKNKVNFQGPELTNGANKFAEWVSKGYIAKDSAGVKAEDMGVSFIQGNAPILISGSWWYGRFSEEIKYDWGTFLFPGNKLNAGSGGNLWVIPSSSKNKSLAYDFIEITMKPEIQNLIGNSGGVPIGADPAAITDAKNKELIENFNAINTANGLAFYPDWPAPGYYDVLVGGMQNLINGSKTPQAVLDEIATPYNDNLASLGK
ncbi:ABC transporter substrate-binding protein [Catenuloplanes japonicus]|uniref:ABC transporter substrate-binding protein n=1 Tax=Catenuloplanes japonicus TaxID=33876 RepID=UPI0005278742|nr:extracellular solute-binding protein [Catenuloplanes japonicus]